MPALVGAMLLLLVIVIVAEDADADADTRAEESEAGVDVRLPVADVEPVANEDAVSPAAQVAALGRLVTP